MARFRIMKPPMKKARIEIIPMIDTIFFLLVFFMFTSLSMVQMKGMGVSFPKDSSSTSNPPKTVIVTVDKAGNYLIGMDKIVPAQLLPDLQQRINSAPNAVIVVNVAKTQNVQTLITVMDAVNQVTAPGGGEPPVMIATTTINAQGEAGRQP